MTFFHTPHTKYNDPFRRWVKHKSKSEEIRGLLRDGLNTKQIKIVMALRGRPVSALFVRTMRHEPSPQYYTELGKKRFVEIVSEETKSRNDLNPLSPRTMKLITKFRNLS